MDGCFYRLHRHLFGGVFYKQVLHDYRIVLFCWDNLVCMYIYVLHYVICMFSLIR